jgi:hypothetical protein
MPTIRVADIKKPWSTARTPDPLPSAVLQNIKPNRPIMKRDSE